MEKQKKGYTARTVSQVERMRALYSQIGEPLPADVIIDLYLHLDEALEAAGREERPTQFKRKKACGGFN